VKDRASSPWLNVWRDGSSQTWVAKFGHHAILDMDSFVSDLLSLDKRTSPL
jgi:hypothetical protein